MHVSVLLTVKIGTAAIGEIYMDQHEQLNIVLEGMRNGKYFSFDLLDITRMPQKGNAVPLTDTASIWFGR